MDGKKAAAPGRECSGKRIEWTGAGADHFLAVVVDDSDEVIAERWGTRNEIVTWIETQRPQLPAEFVSMVLSVSQRRAERPKTQPSTRRKTTVLGFEWRAGDRQ